MEAIDFRAHRRREKIEWQYNTIQYNTIQYNKDLLLIFKSGRFYNTYGDDSIILNYLFGYKIIKENKVGFPINSIVKVLNTLEDKKISYEVIDKNENPYGKKYDNLNNYHNILNKAYEYQEVKVRVKRVYDKINEITDVGVLDNILKVIEDELFKW